MSGRQPRREPEHRADGGSPSHPPSDHEELRLAVTMVGGSSLCVYIGGVAHELRRVTRSNARGATLRDVYGELRALLRTDARIDVVTGTSAGGLNGACLALAQTRGGQLGSLRNLWMDKGDFTKLLHPIGNAAPASVLRGDEFFLPELNETMKALWRGVPAEADHRPLHLQLTVVSMEGIPRRHLDAFGTPLHNIDHLAYCTFERPPHLPADVHLADRWRRQLDAVRDDFAREEVADELALAARSSASFPVAFEPSLVPMTEQDAEHRPLHPNMEEVVSLHRTGFVLDGGVLMNQPVRPALRAIYDMAASQQVRRVLAFVVPHPKDEPDMGPVAEEAPPASAVLAKTLVTLPRSQSLTAEFEQLRAHNRSVRSRRAQRLELMEVLDDVLGSGAPADHLLGLVAGLWPLYRAAHQRRLVEWILDEVERGATALQPDDEPTLAGSWDRDLLRGPLTEALGSWDMPLDNLLAAESLETGPAWRWDVSAFDRMAAIALDLLKRTVWLVALRADPEGPLPPQQREALGEVQAIRRDVHARLAAVRLLRTIDRGYWAGTGAGALEALRSDGAEMAEALAAWATQAVAGWPGESPDEAPERARRPRRWTEEPARARACLRARPAGLSLADAFRAELAEQALALAGDLLRILPAVRTAAEDRTGASAAQAVDTLLRAHPRTRTHEQERTRQYARLLDLLFRDDAEGTLRMLLALQVIQQVAGGEDVLEQPIELVQIDANTPSPFGPEVRSGWGKLGGAKLGHFGAFYKQSWSANDWMWGRLDGAARLVEILLDPARFLQLGYRADSAAAAVWRIALGGPARTDTYLVERWLDDWEDMLEELAFLDDPDRPLPPRLPVCAAAGARRLQLEILREELPVVARAVRADLDAGAARTPASTALLALLDEGPIDSVGSARLVDVLATAQVGREPFTEEVCTDRFTRLASHGAVVAAAAAGTGAAGPLLAPVRLLANGVRGGLLVLAVFAKAAARGWRRVSRSWPCSSPSVQR